MRESLGIIRFRAALAQFEPTGGQQITEMLGSEHCLK